jgi:hypothetical protein
LMRSAAASVSRITWGLGRKLAILAPHGRDQAGMVWSLR